MRQNHEHRAKQNRIRGDSVRRYVDEWIIGLEDATPLAHTIKAAIDTRKSLPDVPEERIYNVDDPLAQRLRID
jgi:hypothetical protein